MRRSGAPAVAVVMPLYNKAAEVARAVTTVLGQSVADFELIVIDDGSTDGSGEVVAGLADPRIRLLRQENRGVSAARNRGVSEARAELIAFLDADDEWEADFLETVLRLRLAAPECEVFVTAYRYRFPDGAERGVYFLGMPAHPFEGPLLLPLSYDFDPPISMSAFAVTKRAMLAVGGFPEGIAVGEDVVARLRLITRFPVAYSTNPCSVYWKSGSLPPQRKPEYPDQVALRLGELLPTLSAPRAEDLRLVIANWHRRRGVMNIGFGALPLARFEIGRAISIRGLNLDLALLYAAASLPLLLSRPLLQLLVQVKGGRRRLSSLRLRVR